MEIESGARVSEEGRRGGAHWSWEGVAGRGGGLNTFCSGPKCPPRLILSDVVQDGACLLACPVLGTPQLHCINRLELIIENLM